MARPHIEFIHAQVLAWETGPLADVEIKVLSRDTDSGAASLIQRYPAGWSGAAPYHLEAAEEFVVLEGEIAINGVPYTELTYAHLPARHGRREVRSEGGAVVLSFFDASPAVTRGDGARPRGSSKRSTSCAKGGMGTTRGSTAPNWRRPVRVRRSCAPIRPRVTRPG